MPAMTQKLPSTLATSREFFQRFGSRGSALTVVPFNQGSKQDVDVLVDYIYMALGLDISTMLSLPLPFPRLAARSTVSTGNDGRYSDCKISLETLINHWSFQSWGEHLCPVGVVIGLMDQSDMIAQEIETHGVTQVEPDWADLSVGFDCVNMNKKAELRRAIVREIIDGADAVHVLQTVNVAPRANFLFEFPELPGTHTLQSLSQLRDVIDLIKSLSSLALVKLGADVLISLCDAVHRDGNSGGSIRSRGCRCGVTIVPQGENTLVLILLALLDGRSQAS